MDDRRRTIRLKDKYGNDETRNQNDEQSSKQRETVGSRRKTKL